MKWDVTYVPEYWVGKRLNYPNVPLESPKFAKTEVVGNLIFISGCTGQDTVTGKPTPTTFEEQMVSALDKIKGAMEASGSKLENLVKTLMLLKNLEDYPKMRRIETEYYQKHAPYLVDNPPASTFIQVKSLAKPEFLVEIDAFGVVSRDMPGWEVKYVPEYWVGKRLNYPNVPLESPKFAKTEVVGNLILISGGTGQDTVSGKPTPTTFEEQMVSALDKIKGAMEASGSRLENLVKTLMLLKNLEDYPKMRRIETEYYQKHAPYLVDNPPASTFIQVKSLAKPEFLVEIDAMGAVSRDMAGWEVEYVPEYWVGKRLNYPNVPLESPKFAKTEVVGNLIFISGGTGQDTVHGNPTPTSFEEQMVSALDKIKGAMEASGSSLDKLVKTLMLLKNLEDYPKMRRIETEYYQKHAPYLVDNPPASTFIQVKSLAKPEFLVEIDAFGVR